MDAEVTVKVRKDGIEPYPWTVRCPGCPTFNAGSLRVINSNLGYSNAERAIALAFLHAVGHRRSVRFLPVNLMSTGSGV